MGDGITAISTITITDDATTATINTTDDIRIRIPSGFDMTWDTSDTTATIGGTDSGKVSGTVSYEDSGATLVIDVTTNFSASDDITISDLSFTAFTATEAADNLELEVSNDGGTNDEDSNTISIGGAPTLTSAANQSFTVGDGITAISTITITDDATTASINATDDIRIRIPSGFDMTWDTSDTTATIGGTDSGKVSGTVSYEDSGATLVIDVTTNFSAGDDITISDLGFTAFTATEAADNLELEVSNDGGTNDEDSNTIAIGGAPTIASAANQSFTVGDGITAISTITITDDGTTATINTTDDIRIRIPSGFDMTWDTSDTTATIGGTDSGNVSSTVSYEDSGATLVIDVTTNFSAGDDITVSGLGFTAFTATEAADNLELEVSNDGGTNDEDSNTIAIGGAPTIASAANQSFTVGDGITAISTITITDDATTASINATDDIRIRIPSGFDMTWDTSDTSATIGGTDSGKVSSTVSYEDSGATLVIAVTTNFDPGDDITISDLGFTAFAATRSR